MKEFSLSEIDNTVEPTREDEPEYHCVDDIKKVWIGCDEHPDDASGRRQPIAKIEPLSALPDKIADGASLVPQFTDENYRNSPEDIAERDELWSDLRAAPRPLVGHRTTECGTEVGNGSAVAQPADIAFVSPADIQIFKLILENILKSHCM